MAALAGGHVDVMFAPLELSAKLVDGKLADLLAVSRHGPGEPAGHGLPTLAEVWPGFVLEGMMAVYVPAGMSDTRLRQLHRDLTQAMSDPETLRRLQATGMDPLPPSSAEAFGQLMRGMFSRYEQMARDIGLPRP
jgi:tripartite-type tricarboxylate transporter receptor subunit TctC